MSMRPFTRLEDGPKSVAIWDIYFVPDPKHIDLMSDVRIETIKGENPLYLEMLEGMGGYYTKRGFYEETLNSHEKALELRSAPGRHE